MSKPLHLSLCMWIYSFLPQASAHLDKINEFIAAERVKAEKSYDKDEHGNKDSFVNLSVTYALDEIIDKYLNEKTMKKLPRRHLTEATYEGLVVKHAAEYMEKAAIAGVDTKGKSSAFTKESVSCTDMLPFHHFNARKQKCSPETISNCLRQNVADFKGPEKWESTIVPKVSLNLVNTAAEQLGRENYAAVRELAMRIKDHAEEKIGKDLHFASATLEPASSPHKLSVDGARMPGVDYSAVFLLGGGGSFRFRNADETKAADQGLIFWSSGTENKVESDGDRLHLRFTCSPDFSDDTLLEKLSKRPGKGRVINATETGDPRLWGIFIFVLQWMFRF